MQTNVIDICISKDQKSEKFVNPGDKRLLRNKSRETSAVAIADSDHQNTIITSVPNNLSSKPSGDKSSFLSKASTSGRHTAVAINNDYTTTTN